METQSPFPKTKRGRVPFPQNEKGAEPPEFSAHVYCGQMAAWIKMEVDMEVRLSPDDFVLDEDPAPLPKKGAEPPSQCSAHFYCGQTPGCIKMPPGMEVNLSPGDFVLDGDPVPLPKMRAEPPNFRPMFIVAKWLHGSRWHFARR